MKPFLMLAASLGAAAVAGFIFASAASASMRPLLALAAGLGVASLAGFILAATASRVLNPRMPWIIHTREGLYGAGAMLLGLLVVALGATQLP